MALLSPRDRIRVGLRRLKGSYRKPLAVLDDLGDQLGFYGRALAWTPRTLRRYKRETLRLLARGQLRHRCAGGHRRHGRRHRLPVVLHRHRGGACRATRLSTSSARRRSPASSPRTSTPGRSRPLVAGPGAVGHRRLRVHRADRRDADQRGDRRPRGHGRAVAAVPRDHPHHRRLHRRHPAVRAGTAHQLLRDPDHRDAGLRPVRGHLRPLLQPVPAAGGRAVVVPEGAASSPS